MDSLGSSKVTRKFQVTVPKAVREAMMLEKGDFVVFVGERGRISVKRGRLEVEK
ncbi:MAG: AbrB/MazE/SpoVT family DNA-binding domain-containing protein [Candidatus Bathyarchaeia archaeon]|jgi:AbrB family looped-hinge helix DNA binding protein